MSITNRVTLFFLVVLGAILTTSSVGVYGAARFYLEHELEEHLAAAIETLSVAVETKPGHLEWDANERQLNLGMDDGDEQVRWLVGTPSNALLAKSANLGRDTQELQDRLVQLTTQDQQDSSTGQFTLESGESWGWQSKRLKAESASASTASDSTGGDAYSSEIDLLAAVSLAPMQQTLRTLLLSTLGVSAALWTVAALVSRRICRQALAPLTEMSAAAKSISATELDRRLPVAHTHDELYELAQAFNDLLARVQRSYERQRNFTAQASHQLRTPLAALLGQVEVTLRKPRPAEDYRQALQQAHEQAIHLTRIVEALLLLARSADERGGIQMEDVDLAAWIRDHTTHWQSHPRWHDLSVRVPSIGVRVVTSPLLLSQIVDNLIDNAFKHSAPNSRIILEMARKNGHATISVQDKGSGIPENEISQVFSPFFRSDIARERGVPGSGLGLAVVERIAASLDIKVTLQTAENIGTNVILEIPVEPFSANRFRGVV